MKNLATTLPKRRTSLDLPPDLLERTDEAVKLGVASSRNRLIAAAVEGYLDALDRSASIDARFAEMQEDTRYLQMHRELTADFAASDAEVLIAGDAEAPVKEEAGP